LIVDGTERKLHLLEWLIVLLGGCYLLKLAFDDKCLQSLRRCGDVALSLWWCKYL
jgi:hypothetical protein